ncbi:hypothetical protein AAVH_09118 [Aphelenchoides avenae]|nr:hypothetical protein AAVH_09118 [Aphelenchus avenae]
MARSVLAARRTNVELPQPPTLHEVAAPAAPTVNGTPAPPPTPAALQPPVQEPLAPAPPPETPEAPAVPVRAFDDYVRAPLGHEADFHTDRRITLRVANVLLDDPVYVRQESASSVGTYRYEPGFLRAELTGSVYRIEVRNNVTVFAHVSQLRQRRWDNAKPFEIGHDFDQDAPEADPRSLTCDLCDLSEVHDLQGLTLFNNYLILRDQHNREHWIDLNRSSDWTLVDRCFASASRRTAYTRSLRIVSVQLPLAKAHMLADRLKQLSSIETIILPAVTDFAHQLEAAPFLNSLTLFTDLAKITDAPGLDFVPRQLFATFTVAACSIYEGPTGRREARFTFDEDYMYEGSAGHLRLESSFLLGFLREWNAHDARFRITELTIALRSLQPWGNIDMTLNELQQLYQWPNVKAVTLYLFVEYQFADNALLGQERFARRHENRLTRRYLLVRSAVRTFLRCADRRIRWKIALVMKLHNIRPGEHAENFAAQLQNAIPALVRVPNPNYDSDPVEQLNDDTYAQRPSETFNRAMNHLRQRLILIQRPCVHSFTHHDDPAAPRDAQLQQALRFQNVYGT